MTQPASKRLVSEARFNDISTAAANNALAGAQSQIDASAASAAASANSAAQSAASATAPTDSAVANAVNTTGTATQTALDAKYKAPTRRVRYVDANIGADTNTGASPAQSLKTIQAAHDALGADGGRILVHDGIYAPFQVTNNGVSVESLGGRRKTIISTSSLSANGVQFLGASSSVTIVQSALVGFTVVGPGKASGGTGVGVYVLNASVDLLVEDCWVENWGSHGISTSNSYSMTFRKTLLDSNGGDGFNGQTNTNNVTFDRTIAINNTGRGYAVVGGTSCLFLNADAESNTGAGFDLRYVTTGAMLSCHMEKNGADAASPNIYLHFRTSLSEKTTAFNVMGCVIQGQSTTKRGLVIDGASRTNVHGNWFANHVTDHVQTTSNADRTWIGPNTYTGTGTELTDGSASTVRMDYDYTNLCARTDVLRYAPRSLNPAALAQGQTWWSSTTDQLKARDASAIRTIFTGWQGTGTLAFPSIPAGGSAELTITVTGAVTGDSVTLGPPGTLEAGLLHSGRVTATNTVTVRLYNSTTAAVTPASAGWKANVIRS